MQQRGICSRTKLELLNLDNRTKREIFTTSTVYKKDKTSRVLNEPFLNKFFGALLISGPPVDENQNTL